MKYYITGIVAVIFLFSFLDCTPKNNLLPDIMQDTTKIKDSINMQDTTKPIDTTMTTTDTTTVVAIPFKGEFVDDAHPTSGTVTINMDSTLMSFKDFKSDDGPLLNIYLASDIKNVNADYKDLGTIKGLSGDYTYDIPVGVDLLSYEYVVVWCVQFNVSFGHATLAPN